MDFDMTNICEMNSIFHKKLKGLVELSECRTGKLGVYEDEIYVSWNYFQGLQRRFYGESIDTLLIFLTKNIQDYCIFYRMILECQKKFNYAANEVAANEVAANEVAANEVAANEVAANEVAANEVAANEVATNEVAANEVAANEVEANEVAANEVAANEVAANETKVDDDGEKIDSLEKENSIFAENIVKGLKILQQQYETNDNRVKIIIDLMNMINLSFIS